MAKEKQNEYCRRYYARQKEKNKMRKITIGEGSSQSTTLVETTQVNINETTPVSALSIVSG